MAILPTSLGIRPRLAVELRAEGVVAARAEEGSARIASASRVELGPGAAIPHLRAMIHGTTETIYTPLQAAERALLVTAIRSALESVAGRGRDTTVVLPDSAVRVLLLDFDALPARPAEALPVVRFRLKKLVPFDADTAAVSYQVMSSTRGNIRVLAVAIPNDLLSEFESIVREAGFEPGAVLPSTLASLAALPDGDAATLLINTSHQAVTTAITRGNVLLLHRSIDFAEASNLAEISAPAYSAASAYAGPQIDAASGWELAQAISVAAAYFEDTLQSTPGALLSSGTVPPSALSGLLANAGFGPVSVEDLLPAGELTGQGSRIPAGWLAGVRGALAS